MQPLPLETFWGRNIFQNTNTRYFCSHWKLSQVNPRETFQTISSWWETHKHNFCPSTRKSEPWHFEVHFLSIIKFITWYSWCWREDTQGIWNLSFSKVYLVCVSIDPKEILFFFKFLFFLLQFSIFFMFFTPMLVSSTFVFVLLQSFFFLIKSSLIFGLFQNYLSGPKINKWRKLGTIKTETNN